MTINGINGLDWSQNLSQMLQKRINGQESTHLEMADSGRDTVNISSDGKVLAQQHDDTGFSILTTLTAADKQTIKGATGWDIDKDPTGATASEGAKDFAGRLNLDRYTLAKYGSADGFTGAVDQAYIQHVIQEQVGGQGMVPLSVLYKIQDQLAKPSGTMPA
jgi:hypothetical protein